MRLGWRVPGGTPVVGYNLYRSGETFTSTAQAVKLNSEPVSGTYYYDLPPADGTWHYRILAVNAAGTAGELSAPAVVTADSTMPYAVRIGYAPAGNHDPETGRTGSGMVTIPLEVSEPLVSTPFLNITPSEGQSRPVDLRQKSDLVYTGRLDIRATTPTGTAYAVFSARDLAGNRGTQINDGAILEIDTRGPRVIELTVSAGEVIINDSADPATVIIRIGLDEPVAPQTVPSLSYLLSGVDREPVVINTLMTIDSLPGHLQTWETVFQLPADAGLAGAESLQFFYSASDDLGNTSDAIEDENLFQVYQGELPPLEPPGGLSAASMADSLIRLAWSPVNEAAGYQLYRQAPGEESLALYQTLTGEVVAYDDVPAADGIYTYAVTSIRREFGLEAVSGQSEPVSALADSIPPQPPAGLTLELAANGIVAQWQAAPYTDGLNYRLYRADAAVIDSVAGMDPLYHSIPQTLVVDPHPSATEHCYTVTAVDGVGNESSAAASVYYNPGLLPVRNLKVHLVEGTPPLVSWIPPEKPVAGYNIFLVAEGEEQQLNSVTLSSPLYMDTGYTDGGRRYTVKAVDTYGAESLGRSIRLPAIRAVPQKGNRILRGVMNRLDYIIENRSDRQVDHVRMQVQIYGCAHFSEEFSLAPGENRPISLTVGGYDDLPDQTVLATVINIRPGHGDEIQIARNDDLRVEQGMLVLDLHNEEFVRGVTGTANNRSCGRDTYCEIPSWPHVGKFFETGPFMGLNFKLAVERQQAWLDHVRPDYLMMISARLEHLALGYQERRPPGLRDLLAISQEVTPQMRRHIETLLAASLHQNYGLNEIGLVASRCPEEGRYHVHTEHALVEVVDSRDRPCKPGESGRLLVTGLRNPAMPLIRYDSGDLAVATEEPCPCGRTLPSFGGIRGRYTDITALPEGCWQYWVICLETLEGMDPQLLKYLRQYQMHLSADGSFELRLAVRRKPPPEFTRCIREAWNAGPGEPPPLTIRQTDFLPLPENGKFHTFTTDFSAGDLDP